MLRLLGCTSLALMLPAAPAEPANVPDDALVTLEQCFPTSDSESTSGRYCRRRARMKSSSHGMRT